MKLYLIFTNPDNIVVTTGIQQCLSILTDMKTKEGRHKILIEQPTYHCYMDYLKLRGIGVETIERNFSGIDLDDLERIFARDEIKFFYTMPRVHNTLGTHLCSATKQKIIELAYKYDVYIVEDDYMADYITDKTNDPMITYDLNRSHVIYVRSFSKSIFPGLRVGFAVLPKRLISTFSEEKYFRDMGTSILAQASLDVYLRNKMYERHMAKMIQLYEERATLLRTVLSAQDVDGSYATEFDSHTIHTCLKLDKPYSQDKLTRSNITVADINRFYYSNHSKSNYYLALNVSNASVDQISEGISKLISIVRD